MSVLSLRRHYRGLGLSSRRRRATTHQAIVTDGLIAEWRFDDGPGQQVTDYGGNNHHITLPSAPNTPTWQSSGLSFDGVDDYATSSNMTITTGAFHVDIVAKFTGGDTAVIANFASEASDQRTPLMLFRDGANATVFYRVGSGSGLVQVEDTISTVFDKLAPHIHRL